MPGCCCRTAAPARYPAPARPARLPPRLAGTVEAYRAGRAGQQPGQHRGQVGAVPARDRPEPPHGRHIGPQRREQLARVAGRRHRDQRRADLASPACSGRTYTLAGVCSPSSSASGTRSTSARRATIRSDVPRCPRSTFRSHSSDRPHRSAATRLDNPPPPQRPANLIPRSPPSRTPSSTVGASLRRGVSHLPWQMVTAKRAWPTRACHRPQRMGRLVPPLRGYPRPPCRRSRTTLSAPTGQQLFRADPHRRVPSPVPSPSMQVRQDPVAGVGRSRVRPRQSASRRRTVCVFGSLSSV